jgi:hypothetical protein
MLIWHCKSVCMIGMACSVYYSGWSPWRFLCRDIRSRNIAAQSIKMFNLEMINLEIINYVGQMPSSAYVTLSTASF